MDEKLDERKFDGLLIKVAGDTFGLLKIDS
jgi:hypothetical protein